VCATKHGVGVAGLRRRATLEAWDKTARGTASAARPEPPVRAAPAPISPGGVGRSALARASEALLDGRPAEAEAIIRALDVVLPVAELFGDDDKAAGELMHLYEDDPAGFAALGRWAEHWPKPCWASARSPPPTPPGRRPWRARRARLDRRGEGEAAPAVSARRSSSPWKAATAGASFGSGGWRGLKRCGSAIASRPARLTTRTARSIGGLRPSGAASRV
jgi:hypothetical protein